MSGNARRREMLAKVRMWSAYHDSPDPSVAHRPVYTKWVHRDGDVVLVDR